MSIIVTPKKSSKNILRPQKGNNFINRNDDTNHSSFFFFTPSPEYIIQEGLKLTKYIPIVMQQLQKPYHSEQDFIQYINSINPKNKNAFKEIHELFNMAQKQDQTLIVKSALPPLRNQYPYNDIRYSNANDCEEMLCDPIYLHNKELVFTLNQPNVEKGNHIIMQCFKSGTYMLQWPRYLLIRANNIQVKPYSNDFFDLIDFTKFGKIDSIQIVYKPFRNSFVLLFRQAKYREIDEIINDLYKIKEPETYYDEKKLNLLCPISGEIMENPGKGKHCCHFESFDLKNFLLRKNWKCPICSNYIDPNDLVYCHKTKETINLFKKNSFSDLSFDDFGSESFGLIQTDYTDFNFE